MAVIMGTIENSVELRIISANYGSDVIDPNMYKPDGMEVHLVNTDDIMTAYKNPPKTARGKGNILYYNTKTKVFFYKTEDRELTGEEQLAALKEENLTLKLAIVNMHEMILLGGAKA